MRRLGETCWTKALGYTIWPRKSSHPIAAASDAGIGSIRTGQIVPSRSFASRRNSSLARFSARNSEARMGQATKEALNASESLHPCGATNQRRGLRRTHRPFVPRLKRHGGPAPVQRLPVRIKRVCGPLLPPPRQRRGEKGGGMRGERFSYLIPQGVSSRYGREVWEGKLRSRKFSLIADVSRLFIPTPGLSPGCAGVRRCAACTAPARSAGRSGAESIVLPAAVGSATQIAWESISTTWGGALPLDVGCGL